MFEGAAEVVSPGCRSNDLPQGTSGRSSSLLPRFGGVPFLPPRVGTTANVDS
jgi:hypothetical protein